jgi:deltex-like protein
MIRPETGFLIGHPNLSNISQYIFSGNQPKGGTMATARRNYHLAGFPDCGTIVITYNFSGGIQGPEHPNPGKPYFCQGFPRVAYLPDNSEGEKALG